MTERISNLNGLFVDTIKDLYDAEQQIVKAMPKMIDQAQSEDLKQSFKDHLEQTRKQIDRLDEVFVDLKMTAKGKHCKGMEGIIKEWDEVLTETNDPLVKDAALIASAQKVEHYEIAGYGTARSYASELGYDSIASLLDKTVNEEGQTDKKLTRLAERRINAKAKTKTR